MYVELKKLTKNRMSIEIIPAIMPKSIEDIKSKIGLVSDLVSTIQLDLMDGDFVPNQTWPYNGNDDYQFEQILAEEEGLPFWDRVDFEFDLMVRNSEKQFDTFIKMGAKRVVFHLEAENSEPGAFKEFIEAIDVYTREILKIGISIGMDTPLEDIYPFLNHVDFVQLMGIDEIGFQGEEFDERVLDRIRLLRSQYKDLSISVDGSVNLETAPKIIDAGANILVVGSAIWKSQDPRAVIIALKDLG